MRNFVLCAMLLAFVPPLPPQRHDWPVRHVECKSQHDCLRKNDDGTISDAGPCACEAEQP